jgi:hypothetical protein
MLLHCNRLRHCWQLFYQIWGSQNSKFDFEINQSWLKLMHLILIVPSKLIHYTVLKVMGSTILCHAPARQRIYTPCLCMYSCTSPFDESEGRAHSCLDHSPRLYSTRSVLHTRCFSLALQFGLCVSVFFSSLINPHIAKQKKKYIKIPKKCI